MATSYKFRFPGSCAGLDVQVYDSSNDAVGSASTVGAPTFVWGAVFHTASLPYDADGYVARVTDEHGIVIASAKGVIDVEAAIGALPSVAAFVPNASTIAPAASVDALRDALIAAGLMASQ